MIAPPVLLHTSLTLRRAVGDARGLDIARQIGGGLNVLALLTFAAITAGAAIRAGRCHHAGTGDTAAAVTTDPPGPLTDAGPQTKTVTAS